jgi:8-oxo-dGTP pyrophosphatase MutT (NUDIX family)
MKKTYKVGAGVLPLAVSTGRVLLGLRAAPCSEPGTWSSFGGLREPEDASLEETALRELAEETGYIEPIALTTRLRVVRGSTKAFVFVGLVPEEFEPVLNWEHSGAIWVDPTTLDLTKMHWPVRLLFENAVRSNLPIAPPRARSR